MSNRYNEVSEKLYQLLRRDELIPVSETELAEPVIRGEVAKFLTGNYYLGWDAEGEYFTIHKIEESEE